MKYLVKSLAMAVAVASVLSGQVFGADSDADVLLESNSSFVEFGGGWYLRGDISANINGSRISEAYSAGVTQTDTEFRDMMGYAIGAGFRFTNKFRADLTIGQYISGANGGTYAVAASNCPGLRFNALTGNWDPVDILNCSGYDTATYSTTALMGTGYLDFTPMGGFEPFVGLGLGIARVRWDEVAGGIICSPVSADVNPEVCIGTGGTQPNPNEVYEYGGVNASGVDYRLAYSVTAGFGYRVSKNMLLDLSYRFVGISDTMGIASGSGKAQSTAKSGFGLHQINFGVRYEIW